MNIITSISLSACLFASSEAFAPQRIGLSHQQVQSKTSLNAFAPLSPNNESDAMYLMLKAKECAFSDTCSIDDAQYYLNEVVHVESSCAAGALSGNQVCDLTMATEIVAKLNDKIKKGIVINTKPALSLVTNPAVQLLSMSMVAVAMTVVLSTADMGERTPFTLQEWYWATKGGYLPDVFSQYLKYGGLSPVDSYNMEAIPLQFQEWWWAARDGYLPNLVHHYAVNGGL